MFSFVYVKININSIVLRSYDAIFYYYPALLDLREKSFVNQLAQS